VRASLLFYGVKNWVVHDFRLVVVWNQSSHEILKEIVLVLDALFVGHYNTSIYILVQLIKIVDANKSCLKVVVDFYRLVNKVLLKVKYQFLGHQESRKSQNHNYEREKHFSNSTEQPSKH
jgi:hypothetical protein